MAPRPQLPTAADVALAPLVGAPFFVVLNAASIATTVETADVGLRALHHLFAAFEILGVAACLAAPAALVMVLPRKGPRWLAWLAMAVVCTVAMHFVLSVHLVRQADGPLDGRMSWLLMPLYLLLCGCAVPASYVVGSNAGRIWWLAYVGVGLGLAGIVVAHVIYPDDYVGIHLAIIWCSTIVCGGAAGRLAQRRLERASVWMKRGLLGAAVMLGLFALLVPPPNDVRVELFREPGAVVPYALARSVWGPPPLDLDEPVTTPEVEPYPDDVLVAAASGIADDPVVVLLTVDALRADVAADPENADRFEWLTWLCENGACFDNAVAGSSGTSVSLTTMFSSRYYSQLRWGWYGSGSQRFRYPADDESPRFPELLSAAGVETSSVLALTFLAGENGVGRGFVNEQIVAEPRRHARANQVLAPMVRALNEVGEGQHFFYAHIMEPHEPYDRGEVTEGTPFERYLSEVELTDSWIAYVWRVLRRAFPRRGYMIVSADHGEAFGEHNTHFHSKTLYDELLAVPLIIWGPGIAAGRHEQRVSVVDIGPTVLHLFSVDVPDSFMGRSLLPLAQGLVEEVPRPVFAEGRLRRAYYTGDLKVIEDTVRQTVEVYDLSRDPEESHNIFGEESARSAPAVAELRAFFERVAERSPGYSPPYRR